MSYDWDFNVLMDPAVQATLWRGLLINLQITAMAIVVGTPLGLFVGILASIGGPTDPAYDESRLATLGRMRVLRAIVVTCRFTLLAIVDVVRAIPLLLFIVLAYYGLPILINATAIQSMWHVFGYTGTISPVACCTAAISINLAAFVADVVRGATAGVPRGSILAGRSLGMTPALIWRRIIVPDVIREAFPAITLLWITIAKMSTLVSAVAVPDLLHAASTVMNQRYRPLELLLVVGVIFVVVLLPLTALARGAERSQPLLRRSL